MNIDGLLPKLLMILFLLILLPSAGYLGYKVYQNETNPLPKADETQTLSYKSDMLGVEFKYEEGLAIVENKQTYTLNVADLLTITNDKDAIRTYEDLLVQQKDKISDSELLKQITLNGETYTFVEHKITNQTVACGQIDGFNNHFLKTKENLLITATLPVRSTCPTGGNGSEEATKIIDKVRNMINSMKISTPVVVDFCKNNTFKIVLSDSVKGVECVQDKINNVDTFTLNKNNVSISFGKEENIVTKCEQIKAELTKIANQVCADPANNVKEPRGGLSLCDNAKANANKSCEKVEYISEANYKVHIIKLDGNVNKLVGSFTQSSLVSNIFYTNIGNSSITKEDKAIVMEILSGVQFQQ